MGIDFYAGTRTSYWGDQDTDEDWYEYIDDPDGHPSWSYGGFARFRRNLAAEVGINLDNMIGFSGDRPGIEWDNYLLTEPLVPFLHHSDCDGELSPEVCATVAPRLREIITKWPEKDEEPPSDKRSGYDRMMGLRLASLMETAARNGAELLFQ